MFDLQLLRRASDNVGELGERGCPRRHCGPGRRGANLRAHINKQLEEHGASFARPIFGPMTAVKRLIPQLNSALA
jgi:hypothetical protein